jgi:cell division protein FtsW (lipid II flippase)
MMTKGIRSAGIIWAILMFEAAAFLLLFFASSPWDVRILGIAVGAMGLFVFQYSVLTLFFVGADRTALIVANFLAGVGLIVQTRIDPALAMRQLLVMGVGVLAMVVAALFMRRSSFLKRMRAPFIALSFALLLAAIVLGKAQGGASNWFTVFGISVQPSEFVKILLIFVLASLLDRDRSVAKMLIATAYVAVCLVLLLVQKDLGAALLYAGTAVALLYAATGNKLLLLGSLGAGTAGAAAAYKLFAHVRVRVALWRNPWAMYEGQGYQVVQGLIAIATGGLFGLGLTNGMPRMIPVAHSDYIFAVICQEFGLFFGLILLGFYLVFIVRGALVAMDARASFDALVAIGCVTMISLQSFIIIAGVCKLIPLTGITMPFVSYGGSSMLSCFILLGLLEGVAIENHQADLREYEGDPDEDEWADDDDDYPEGVRRG